MPEGRYEYDPRDPKGRGSWPTCCWRHRGKGGAALPPGTPTPRDGAPEGRLSGIPEPFPDRGTTERQEADGVQAASMQAMAAAGYRVHQQPWVLESDRLAGYHGQPHSPGTPPLPDPDLRLGDNIADVVAPDSDKPDQDAGAVPSARR